MIEPCQQRLDLCMNSLQPSCSKKLCFTIAIGLYTANIYINGSINNTMNGLHLSLSPPFIVIPLNTFCPI